MKSAPGGDDNNEDKAFAAAEEEADLSFEPDLSWGSRPGSSDGSKMQQSLSSVVIEPITPVVLLFFAVVAGSFDSPDKCRGCCFFCCDCDCEVEDDLADMTRVTIFILDLHLYRQLCNRTRDAGKTTQATPDSTNLHLIVDSR